MKYFLAVVCATLLISCSSDADVQSTTYRLTTSFTGPTKPLGVELDSTNTPVPVLVDISQTPSQLWIIEEHEGGLFQITASGSESDNILTVVNDTENTKIVLSQNDASLGQRWNITPLSNGFCRITSQLLGTGSSVDIVNNDEDRELQMAVSGDFSGQYWQVDSATGVSTNETLNQCVGTEQNSSSTNDLTTEDFLPTSAYRQTAVHGFSVLINPDVDASGQIGIDAMAELDDQLAAVVSYLAGDVLTQMQQVRIWVETDQLSDRSGQFHVSELWLTNNGYNPEKAGAVEISNTRIFVQNARELNVSTVLHELSHARQLHLTNNNSALDFEGVYNNALASGTYESVEYVTGTLRPAYAMTNSQEYFAELSEAYFATNDFFPFNRAELLDFDPDGYELVLQAWSP